MSRCHSRRCTRGLVACVSVLALHLLNGSACAQAPQASSRSGVGTVFGAAPAPWAPVKTEVFASSAMYISNAGQASVYRVDARKQIFAEINQGGLPPDQARALEIARERLKAMGPALKQRILDSLQVTDKVVRYGIDRVPAVVFDGQRVVYGVTDVARATEIAHRGGAELLKPRFTFGAGKQGNAGSAAR